METINYIFYYTVLYFPLFFWVIYQFEKVKQYTNQLDSFMMKQIEINSNQYSFKKFFYITLYVGGIFYIVVGAIGAVFQTLIGFEPMYGYENSSFILDILKSAFEILGLIALLSFFRASDFMKPNFSFAKIIYKTKPKPREWIKGIYMKYIGYHVVYILIFYNIYYFIFGEFIFLEGGKYFSLLYWIKF
jgi:hypothetical protein